MQTAQGNALEWEGGSIDDLVAMLAAPALAVRVEVRTPSAGKPRKVGEIHMVAGGVYETIAGELRGDDAMEHLRGVSPLSFRLQPRLPNPDDGGLLIPGPGEGTLAERPPAELMRYCELYVLTCVLEIWRDTDRASVNYTKGEIGTTIVNGVDGSDSLSDVINWDSGGYRIGLPELSLPELPKAELHKPKAASQTQPSRTMFGYPSALAAASASQPLAVQTASPRPTPASETAAAALRPSPVPAEVRPLPAASASAAPAAAAAPAQAAEPTVVAQPQASIAPAAAPPSLESKPVAPPAAEEKPPAPKVAGREIKLQPEPKQNKVEPRKTAPPEPRKTRKSKIPEKRAEEPVVPMVPVPTKTDGSIWSAIGLGLVVGLACAAIYWIVRATGG